MSTTGATRRYTPEDLLEMPDGDRYELVDGELVERNMSGTSSEVGLKIAGRLMYHVEREELGHAFGADCDYRCFAADGNRIRKPDASFIQSGRVSRAELDAGFVTVAPDLAVEVVSPNDLAYKLQVKVDQYLQAGVKLVWVVEPVTKSITVYRPDSDASYLHEDDELSGEDILPGFRCAIRELFPR